MFGYTVGDCRWFVAREAEWNGSSTSGEVLWLKKRTELTRCGRWWGYETDNEVPPLYAREAMHMIEGLLVVSLVVMMVAQLGALFFSPLFPLASSTRPLSLGAILTTYTHVQSSSGHSSPCGFRDCSGTAQSPTRTRI